MTTLSTDLFASQLRRMRGRPEAGRWLRAMPARRIGDLLDPHLSSRRGGRLNPPGSFPVLYAVADEAECRPPLALFSSEEPEAVIAVFSVSLTRILDLADPEVRRQLGVSLRDLLDGDETRISQAIGVAAYNEGFEGVIYPRPLSPNCRNLAIFSDKITSENIQLLELKTPDRIPSPSARSTPEGGAGPRG